MPEDISHIKDLRSWLLLIILYIKDFNQHISYWDLAQPFGYVCHNGEINTFKEISAECMPEKKFCVIFGDDIKNYSILPNKSDSSSMDMVVEFLLTTEDLYKS